MNNDRYSTNKTIEIDSNSDDTNSCEIIDDHHETTGIEVKWLIVRFIL